jgi:hypothetical protein
MSIDSERKEEKKKRIMIAVPTQEYARYAAFYDWLGLIKCPDDCEFVNIRAHGQSPARNRNIMIQQALDLECDYVFFIDDDCLIPPETLIKLYNHNVDIVSGLYCMRNYPHKPIVFDQANDDGTCRWTNLSGPDEGLKKIVATGMGCLLVKTHVFRKIQETEKYWVTLGELEQDHWCDDLSFFKRVRKNGFDIFIDLNCPVGHQAKVNIWPNKIDGVWHITYDTDGEKPIHFPLDYGKQATLRIPSDKRDTTYLNGVMQIQITNICDLSCPNCSQGCNLKTHPQSMTLAQFEEAVISVKDYFGVIGVYGGNPTLHHQFPQICEILRKHIPFERRGLFTNGLSGHGAVCRDTFNPKYCNLNLHGQMEVYEEFKRDWPEALFNVKGFGHSRHTPSWVAIKDMEDLTHNEKVKAILDCDINRYWSAFIGLFRGETRAWFCEIAGAQARLHEDDLSYPDTGLRVEPDWWKRPYEDFYDQMAKHCFDCGIPLRGQGELDNGPMEYVSATHLPIYKLKHDSGKMINLVTRTSQLGKRLHRSTDYIENGMVELVGTK